MKRNPTAYLYIGVHGEVMQSRYRTSTSTSEISTTNILNNYDYLNLDPAKMHVEKVTVSPPGTVGLSSPYIFYFIKDLLLRFPNYAYDSESFNKLLSEYLYTPETIKHRTDITTDIRSHVSDREKEASETACSNIFAFHEPLNFKDRHSSIFMNKLYSVDKTNPTHFDIILFVFMPDTNSFQTFNILSLNFLSKVCPYLLGTIFKDNKIVTINDGYKDIFDIPQSNCKVLEMITLDQIFKVLYWIGITNLYIIDPSCSVVGSPRCNRAACLDFQQSGLDISAIDSKKRSTAVNLVIPEDVFPQLRTTSSSSSSSALLDSSSLGGRSRKRKRRVKGRRKSRCRKKKCKDKRMV